MSEKEVQNHLAMWLTPSLFICPNAPMGGGEADILRYLQTRRIEEYEIKLSRADFRRDFKSKHYKHLNLKGELGQKESPNRFFYVYPKGMLKLEEIPEYAGAVEFEEMAGRLHEKFLNFNVVKKAPLLHSRKCDLKRLAYMIRGLSIRYWEKRRWEQES
jgi:hypothetical protein